MILDISTFVDSTVEESVSNRESCIVVSSDGSAGDLRDDA